MDEKTASLPSGSVDVKKALHTASGAWQIITPETSLIDATVGFHRISALSLYDNDPQPLYEFQRVRRPLGGLCPSPLSILERASTLAMTDLYPGL